MAVQETSSGPSLAGNTSNRATAAARLTCEIERDGDTLRLARAEAALPVPYVSVPLFASTQAHRCGAWSISLPAASVVWPSVSRCAPKCRLLCSAVFSLSATVDERDASLYLREVRELASEDGDGCESREEEEWAGEESDCGLARLAWRGQGQPWSFATPS